MEEGNGGQIARATVIDVPMKGQRDLATVTAEIRTLQDAARRVVLSYSVEIGRRLGEAKSMFGHGEWGDYLKDELGFSQSTANNHMRLFEAYGAEQMTLDGAAVKSQAFVNLTYTQALALLALPSEEEREDFVAGHDMESLSTRELQAEITRLREEKEAIEADARELNAKKRQAEAAAKKAAEAEQAAAVQAAAVQAAKEEMASDARRYKEELEAAQKALKMAAPEMAEFKVRFEGAQEALNRAVDALWALPSDKVDGGVRAVRALLERAGKRLEEERYEEAMPE